MNRRDLLKTTLAAGAAVALGGGRAFAAAATAPAFRLKYAPHFGMFEHHAGKDLVDQLEVRRRPGLHRLGGQRDAGPAGRGAGADRHGDGPPRHDDGRLRGHGRLRERHLRLGEARGSARTSWPRAKAAVEVAKRVNAKWTTVVPGRYDVGLEWDYQTANVIDNLKRLAEVFEPAGLVMVLEPLNPWKDHPGLFLTKIPQAFQICRAVGSPSCKILFDIYHQQITEGNLIPNIDRAWERDRLLPGRRQPGPQGAHHRRDQLPEHLQAHPRQGLHRHPRHGARDLEARDRGREGAHRGLPDLRLVLGPGPTASAAGPRARPAGG